MNEKLRVQFTPSALRQVEQAARWWHDNRSKAPDALESDLASALELIATQPGVGAVARNTRLPGVRRVFLNRVGYYIYYRLHGEPPTSLQVVAFWHASRGSMPRV